jgi:hypothetical protein
MSLRVERIWVESDGPLVWSRTNVQNVWAAVPSWPEESNIADFRGAAMGGGDLTIEELRWGGAGSRNLESLRTILWFCGSRPVKVWVRWDDGTAPELVWGRR